MIRILLAVLFVALLPLSVGAEDSTFSVEPKDYSQECFDCNECCTDGWCVSMCIKTCDVANKIFKGKCIKEEVVDQPKAEEYTESLIQRTKHIIDLYCSINPTECRNVSCCQFYPDEDICDNCNATVEQPKDDKAELPCCKIPENFDNLNIKNCRLCEESKTQQYSENSGIYKYKCESTTAYIDGLDCDDKCMTFWANIATAYCTRALLEEIRK